MQSQQFPRVTLLVLLVVSLLIAACGDRSTRADAVAVNSTPASGGNETSATVSVTVKEMTIALDTTQAQAGTITFFVQNDGHTQHDFAIKGNGIEEKTPLLEPGQSATLTVALSPGSYEYVCTVLGHAMAGMRGTFTVT